MSADGTEQQTIEQCEELSLGLNHKSHSRIGWLQVREILFLYCIKKYRYLRQTTHNKNTQGMPSLHICINIGKRLKKWEKTLNKIIDEFSNSEIIEPHVRMFMQNKIDKLSYNYVSCYSQNRLWLFTNW